MRFPANLTITLQEAVDFAILTSADQDSLHIKKNLCYQRLTGHDKIIVNVSQVKK